MRRGKKLVSIVAIGLVIALMVFGGYHFTNVVRVTGAVSFSDKLDNRPILILAEGQSNMSYRPAYNWTPPKNVVRWNFTGEADPDTVRTGDRFLPLEPYLMGTAYSFAAEFGRANLDRMVYLVQVARATLPIAHWLPNAPAPDMYAATKRNIEPALAAIGRPVKLVHIWWQAESNAGGPNYELYFAEHLARKRKEAWYPASTPLVIMGVSPYVNTIVADMNRQLKSVARESNAVFVDTASIPKDLFDPHGDHIHMLAAGYEAAGTLAYRDFARSGL